MNKLKVSKTLTDICKDLGSEYEIKEIDLENCIYRNLHNGFDFEISGIWRRLGKITCTLFIWDIKEAPLVVEIVDFEKVTFNQFQEVLEKLARKYKDPNVKIPDEYNRRSVIKMN